MTQQIVLTGPMGAGKTTLGRELAIRLGRLFMDSDENIERTTEKTGREIAATCGVPYLHRLERAFVRRVVASPEPAVVAAAASLADDDGLLAQLNEDGHLIVFLDTEDVAAVTDVAGHRRLMTNEEAAALHRQRRANALAGRAIFVPVNRADGVPWSVSLLENALAEAAPSLFDR